MMQQQTLSIKTRRRPVAFALGTPVTVGIYGYRGKWTVISSPFYNRTWKDWEVVIRPDNGLSDKSAPLYALSITC